MDRTDLQQEAKAAHRRVAALERTLLRHWPDAWTVLDRMRRPTPGLTWPDWCLLPMGAPATYIANHPVGPASPIGAMSALYAHRYAGSVWLIEPALASRLLTTMPDALTIDDLAGLPEWCVYVAAAHPEYPGVGVWMHLEHDTNTGRPELRLLLDTEGTGGLETLLPIPVYLDRPSITEALADMRATTLASLGGRTGMNVRGGELDAAAAELAAGVDGYLAIAAYLARPEADIIGLDDPAARPTRLRRPARDRRTWLVGYADS